MRSSQDEPTCIMYAKDVDDENKISLQLLYGPAKLNKKDGYNFGIVYSSLEDVTVTGFFDFIFS